MREAARVLAALGLLVAPAAAQAEPLAKPAPHLPILAAQMRGIALCFDLTAAPSAVEAALDALLANNPALEGRAGEPSP